MDNKEKLKDEVPAKKVNKENNKENNKETKKETKPKKEKKLSEVEQLKIDKKEIENDILKIRAELVNYRRRKEDEMSRLLKYSEENVMRDLITTVDDFERAIKLDDHELDDELSKFLEGFKLIYAHLNNTLTKYEVKAIDGFNKPFDPTYHQAVLTAKVEGQEPGHVIEVLQKGYLYKDRVLRPAMVKVSE